MRSAFKCMSLWLMTRVAFMKGNCRPIRHQRTKKWPSEKDLSLLERESKRARLDVASASSNQIAPETLSRKLMTLNAQSL